MHTHVHHGRLTRAVVVAMAINFVVFAVEVAGAYLADSLALLADALHNLSDFVTLALALVATRLVLRAATTTHTFGLVRSEILVAFVNALTLLLVGGYLVFEGVARILEPTEVGGPLVVAFGGFSLIANVASTLVLKPHAGTDLNARSAFLHLATDAAESGAVVLSGVLVSVGVPLVDPILSIGIGLFTAKGAKDVLVEASSILVEGAPRGVTSEDVARCLREVDGVCDVHHVHVWALSSTYNAASAHVVVPDQMVGRSRELIERMAARLAERCGIDHPTFQIEVADCGDHEQPHARRAADRRD